MRPCFTCGASGMHHHFCALDQKTRARAEEPGGRAQVCVQSAPASTRKKTKLKLTLAAINLET
eukprot:994240-Pleurochrysis_carterae.AAC.1